MAGRRDAEKNVSLAPDRHFDAADYDDEVELRLIAADVDDIAIVPDPIISAARVTVVVPALNEAENLPHVFSRIPREVYEVILVDGGSTDDTVAVAEQMWPNLVVLHQNGKGKGGALAQGFAAATGDIIVMIDADGSTDPEEIPRYVGALLTGADFAKGTRFVTGG